MVLVVIAALPWLITTPYWRGILVLCAMNVLLALSLNLVIGYTGQLNLGQSAFFAIGAYVSTVLIKTYGWNFWLALAVYLTWEALRRPSFLWGVAAGAATGVAWWTKYNGWLPLAIGISALAAWFIFNRPPDKLARRLLYVWLAIAAVAVAVWSPVWFGIQETGGYAVVQANHAGYLVGRAGVVITPSVLRPMSESSVRSVPPLRSSPTTPQASTSHPSARRQAATFALPPTACRRSTIRSTGTGASGLIRSASP